MDDGYWLRVDGSKLKRSVSVAIRRILSDYDLCPHLQVTGWDLISGQNSTLEIPDKPVSSGLGMDDGFWLRVDGSKLAESGGPY
jgi:hypothetical protein